MPGLVLIRWISTTNPTLSTVTYRYFGYSRRAPPPTPDEALSTSIYALFIFRSTTTTTKSRRSRRFERFLVHSFGLLSDPREFCIYTENSRDANAPDAGLRHLQPSLQRVARLRLLKYCRSLVTNGVSFRILLSESR